MKKTYFLVLITLIIITGITSCSESPPEKPNILFIIADDQAHQTIHALGNDEIETPNLDRLANSGVTFSHAYNMGSWTGAVCVASRTQLVTGSFLWEAQKLDQEMEEGNFDRPLWGNLMQQAGYDTYMSGKWHVEQDAAQVFENVTHVRPGMPKSVPEAYDRSQSPEDSTWLPWHKEYGGFWEGGRHWSAVLGDDAVNFLETASQEKDPFFMYLAFNAPHDPRQSPKEYVEKYPLENISLPESFQPLYPNREEIGSGENLRDEELAPFPRTEYAVKVHRQEYYAIISHMDRQIGRILDKLEQSGKAENTYIFFTADHGLAVGKHGLMGKQNMHEHSVRVPFMVAGPDIPEQEQIGADIYLQDVMPTTLELAQTGIPDFVDFHSVMDFIQGDRSQSYYPAIYGGYRDLQRMIRKDGHKLIVYPEAEEMLLYNLEEDPKELNNLANSLDHQQKKEALFEDLTELQQEMDDDLDLREYFPDI